MNVWVIQSNEHIPHDNEKHVTLSRTYFVCEELVKRFHRVTWWASAFSHKSKTFILDEDTEILHKENFKINALHVPIGYKKNISSQ